MELTRRGFIQGAAAGAAAIAVVSAVPGAARAAPILISTPPVTAVAFHQILGAVRDVYSAEIFMAELPVMHFDQFTTREGDQLSIPKFNTIQQLPPTAFDDKAKALVAVQMDRKRSRSAMFSDSKRRSYFDFGGLMSRLGIRPPRGPISNTMPPP